MTGVDDPYEPPEDAEIVVDTLAQTPAQSVEFILRELERMGLIREENGVPSPTASVTADAALP